MSGGGEFRCRRYGEVQDTQPDPAEAYALAEDAAAGEALCRECGADCPWVVSSHAAVWAALAAAAEREREPEAVAIVVLRLAGKSYREIGLTFKPAWPRWRAQNMMRRMPIEVRRLCRRRVTPTGLRCVVRKAGKAARK